MKNSLESISKQGFKEVTKASAPISQQHLPEYAEYSNPGLSLL